MSVERRVLTVHSPVPPALLDRLLSSVERALLKSGAKRVWIDHHYLPDLIVMAELPEVAVPDPAAADVEAEPVTPVVPQPR